MQLLDNRLDLALIEGGISSEELTSELLTEDHLVLIFPSGHPLCLRDSIVLADLIQYPFLVREKGSAGRTFLDHVFAAHGIDFVPLWESASTQALIQAVSAGIGISILPERLVQRDLAEEMICTHPIEDETFRRNNYIAWHHQKFLTDTAKDFIALCHQHSTRQGNRKDSPAFFFYLPSISSSEPCGSHRARFLLPTAATLCCMRWKESAESFAELKSAFRLPEGKFPDRAAMQIIRKKRKANRPRPVS